MSDHKSKFQNYLPIAIFVILLVFCYFLVKPFLISIFLAALLAYIFYPVYKWLSSKIKNKTLSSLLVCILIIILIIVPSALLIKTMVQESYSIYILSKQKLATGIFENCESKFCDSISAYLSEPQVKYQIEQTSKAITQYFIDKGSAFLVSIPAFFLKVFIIFFTLFYFLRDGKDMVERVGYYLSVKQKRYAVIINRLQEVTFGLIYGYVLVALLQGFLGGLGFFLLGLPSPIFWGIIMALLAMIPFLGTGFVWVPAAIIFIVDGIYQDNTTMIVKGIILTVYGFIIVSGADNLIRPKIIGDKAKVHPALILIGIFGGLYFLGPVGILIGPIALSLASIIVETYLGKKPSKKEIQKLLKAG